MPVTTKSPIITNPNPVLSVASVFLHCFQTGDVDFCQIVRVEVCSETENDVCLSTLILNVFYITSFSLNSVIFVGVLKETFQSKDLVRLTVFRDYQIFSCIFD